MTNRKRGKFTEQFEADAVLLITAGGKTIGKVTKQFDLTETTLREWVKRAQADAGKGPPSTLTSSERAELVGLSRAPQGRTGVSGVSGQLDVVRVRQEHLRLARPNCACHGGTVQSKLVGSNPIGAGVGAPSLSRLIPNSPTSSAFPSATRHQKLRENVQPAGQSPPRSSNKYSRPPGMSRRLALAPSETSLERISRGTPIPA